VVNNLLLFVFLFAAIGIGWCLGRRSGAGFGLAGRRHAVSQSRSQSLTYLPEGWPDSAADALIDALEVNSETLETHIALGSLLRRRGEVDRAIRIHENLLARSGLPRAQAQQLQLELARDYIGAGLLDRAERLLLELVRVSPELRGTSSRHLLDVYQSQRDWSQAIAVARQLLPQGRRWQARTDGSEQGPGQPVSVILAHYCCELAGEEQSRDRAEAADLLRQALACDPACVRASIMLGQLELDAGRPGAALEALSQVREQDHDFVPETIDMLRECFRQLGDSDGLRAYLQDCLRVRPSVSLLLAVAEELRASEGAPAAAEFLSAQLAERPSLRGLAHLISLQMDDTDGRFSSHLGLLRLLVDQLEAERPLYRCGHCGFAGRQLHWFCPGCKHWGTIKATGGAHID
jgi:lipopolysaccharide biosynthesis regulator YciM